MLNRAVRYRFEGDCKCTPVHECLIIYTCIYYCISDIAYQNTKIRQGIYKSDNTKWSFSEHACINRHDWSYFTSLAIVRGVGIECWLQCEVINSDAGRQM